MCLILTPARWSARMTKDEMNFAPLSGEDESDEITLRPFDILTYPADFTLEILVSKWNKDEIRSPSLQRRFV